LSVLNKKSPENKTILKEGKLSDQIRQWA